MREAVLLLPTLLLFSSAARAGDDFAIGVGESVDYVSVIPLVLTQKI